MTNKIDSSVSAASALPSDIASTQSKPRFALFIATAGGLGYLPRAPGTWGSLLGVCVTWGIIHIANLNIRFAPPPAGGDWTDRGIEANFWMNQFWCAIVVLLVGLWAAGRAAGYLREKDPQMVVIDEVSGQMICYLGLLAADPIAHSWKYLLLGFILFRVFDIWKPFPARQAESLPGGWGIMADDWVAGIYAAVCLWGARALGL